MLLQVFLRGLKELHGHEAESLLLKTLDDLVHWAMSSGSTVHVLWLDSDDAVIQIGHGPRS